MQMTKLNFYRKIINTYSKPERRKGVGDGIYGSLENDLISFTIELIIVILTLFQFRSYSMKYVRKLEVSTLPSGRGGMMVSYFALL